jgi:hypothetical protein
MIFIIGSLIFGLLVWVGAIIWAVWRPSPEERMSKEIDALLAQFENRPSGI